MYITIKVHENGALLPSARPFVHTTMAEAQLEATRLTKLFPDFSFRVFFSPPGDLEATRLGWLFKLVKKYAQVFD